MAWCALHVTRYTRVHPLLLASDTPGFLKHHSTYAFVDSSANMLTLVLSLYWKHIKDGAINIFESLCSSNCLVFKAITWTQAICQLILLMLGFNIQLLEFTRLQNIWKLSKLWIRIQAMQVAQRVGAVCQIPIGILSDRNTPDSRHVLCWTFPRK